MHLVESFIWDNLTTEEHKSQTENGAVKDKHKMKWNFENFLMIVFLQKHSDIKIPTPRFDFKAYYFKYQEHILLFLYPWALLIIAKKYILIICRWLFCSEAHKFFIVSRNVNTFSHQRWHDYGSKSFLSPRIMYVVTHWRHQIAIKDEN